MTKTELIDQIKSIVKDLSDGKSDLPEKGSDLPISRFDLLNQFPELVEVLTELLTTDFDQFLKNIYWVAPKPTTFKVILINDQYFFLIWNLNNWTVQVEGKKYYIKEVRSSQLAAEAISRILRFGTVSNDNKLDSSTKSKDKKSSSSFEPPIEELPPTEEPEI